MSDSIITSKWEVSINWSASIWSVFKVLLDRLKVKHVKLRIEFKEIEIRDRNSIKGKSVVGRLGVKKGEDTEKWQEGKEQGW